MVKNKYPISKINDVFNFEKYNTKLSNGIFPFMIIQFVVILLFVFHLFNNIGAIGLTNIYIYGFFIFTMVFTATEIMNTNKYAFVFSSIQTLFGISILYYFGGWFGDLTYFYSTLILFYLISSWFITGYYCKVDYFKRELNLEY